MKRGRGQHQNAAGMTVIELAFTISIVGVMMFFALKGRDLIVSMKALATAYELSQYQNFVQQYHVDYRRLPGEDPFAKSRWPRDTSLTTLRDQSLASLEGNDKLDGKLYDIGNPDGEQFTAWRDMRYAGMIEGDPALQGASALPENPFGGFYAFDEGNLGQTGGSLCATRIPGRAAQIIDDKIDDGRINAGKLVATSKFSIEDNNHFDAPDTEPYNIEKEYIICVPMLP
jgi:hypothetical protein